MQMRFLIAVICIFIIGWFAIQNINEEASIKLLFRDPLKVPSVVVIGLSFLIGVLATVAFGIVDQLRLRRTLKEKENELVDLRKRCDQIEDSLEEEEEGTNELSQ